MDAPPSLSSVMIKNFDQQQPQLNEPYQYTEDQYTPSMSDIRSMDSDQSQQNLGFIPMSVDRETHDDVGQPVSIGDLALRREEIQSYQIPGLRSGISDNNEQAPSIGSMVRDGQYSQAGGGKFTYEAPPSRTDVAPRDVSHTGEPSGGEYVPEDDYESVSLTGRNFGKFYTMEFPKEEA